MAWARTLADLVSDVTSRCDVDGYVARHPLVTVRRRVEESYQRLRDWMTSAGSKRWVGAPITLAVAGGTAPVDYGIGMEMRLISGTAGSLNAIESPSFVEAYVEGRWQELECISLADVSNWTSQFASQVKQPRAWFLLGSQGDPVGAEGTVGGQMRIVVCPVFDPIAYPVRVWGVQTITITDADATTLTLDGPGFEWIIWDTVIKILARDNDSAGTYALAVNERAQQEKQIRDGIRAERRTVSQRSDVFNGDARRRLRRPA